MNFEIQILGSSSALPTINRFPTAQILTANEQPYLIDCGEGTQIQMRRFNAKFGKIKHIFISHLHGDHYFGLFGLLSTYNLLGRTEPVNIFADKELENILMSENSPIKYEELSYKLNFFHLPDDTQIIFENKTLTVTAFPLKHRIKTRGFLFKEKKRQVNVIKEKISEYNLSIQQILDLKAGKEIEISGKKFLNTDLTNPAPPQRSFAFCSDTAFNEDIIETIKNVNLLYHEATFSKSDVSNAEKTFHSTAEDAAIMAKKSNAKKLVIGHFSTRYNNPTILLNEAKEIFQNTFLANDGEIFKIEF